MVDIHSHPIPQSINRYRDQDSIFYFHPSLTLSSLCPKHQPSIHHGPLLPRPPPHDGPLISRRPRRHRVYVQHECQNHPYAPFASPKLTPAQMLFTWDTTDLCVVFRQWRITSTLSLVVSLVAVVAICAGYEALREGVRRYEAALSRRAETVPRKCAAAVCCCFFRPSPSPLSPPLSSFHHRANNPSSIHTYPYHVPSERGLPLRNPSLRLESPSPNLTLGPYLGLRHRPLPHPPGGIPMNQLLRQRPSSLHRMQARTASKSRGKPTSPRRCCTASRTFTPS